MSLASLMLKAHQQFLGIMDSARLKRERRQFRVNGRVHCERVSIPIATYDRISVLRERTIPALLSQSHCDVEVVVVGDGTPLSLWRTLEEIDDPRVRLVRLRRRTRYPRGTLERWMVAGWRPRNLGARLSTGSWILWLSDDDVLFPDAIAHLLAVARSNPTADVISGAFEVESVPRRTERPSSARTGLPVLTAGMPALLVRSYTRALRWNRWSYRKRWNRPSDYDLLERMVKRGLRFASTDEVVAIVPQVADTGLVGSKAFAVEEERRSKKPTLR